MRYTWLDEYLVAKQGVVKDHKDEWNWDRYMICDKMFAAVCYDDEDKDVYLTLKVEPLEGEHLRETYADIIPGYYMNKLHWISIRTDGAVEDELVKGLLDRSYALILAGFSKKRQREILEA